MRRLARITAAVLLPWIALELLLRLIGYQPPDNRTRLALFPRFPAFYEPDRDLGWILKPSFHWDGRSLLTPFATDAAGRRVTVGGSEAAPDASGASGSRYAIDFIGDSSTFGYGAADAETYPSRLAQRLAAATGKAPAVRNLGVPGYTAHSAWLLARKPGEHARVSIVMVGFNDHFAAHRRAAADWWRRRIAYACFESRVCAGLFDLLTRPAPLPAGAEPPPTPAPDRYLASVDPAEYRMYLTETVRALRAAGSEPVLLVYPSLVADEKTRQAVADNFHHPRALVDANVDAHPTYQDITREVARSEHVTMVDMAAIFAADPRGNEALHFDWVHPNAAGYDLMAQALEAPVRGLLGKAPPENGAR